MVTVSQCANPKCIADFLRLSDGKLFQCPPEQTRGDRQLLCAWLCEVCRHTHTVEWQNGRPLAVPLRIRRAAAHGVD